MITLVLADCPVGLRGLLTRWLTEISPGVFVGDPSARIREVLWEEVRAYRGRGRAVLTYSTDSEQGFAFATHEHRWQPVDHEGLTLIHRPADRPVPSPRGGPSADGAGSGWSRASKRRRFGGR